MVDALRKDFREAMAALNTRLDRVVSVDVYTLQSAHFDQRMGELARELQKERDEREALEKAFDDHQLSERDRRERERQSRLYQLIIPVLFGVLTLAVAVWAVVAK